MAGGVQRTDADSYPTNGGAIEVTGDLWHSSTGGGSTGPVFTVPDGPVWEPIMEIHRDPDGYVSFHKKDENGVFQDLWSIQAGELSGYFPAFIEHLARDGFFSINSFYRPGYGVSKIDSRLATALRKTSAVRSLNACFVDLDVGRPGCQLGAFAAIGQASDILYDISPWLMPSMAIKSGRGAWLLWFLEQPNGLPVRCWPEKLANWYMIQRALHEILADKKLHSDRGSQDAARVCRVPGSINSKADDRSVIYSVNYDAKAKPLIYTLEQLNSLLDIKPKRLDQGVRKQLMDPAISALKRRGWVARWARTLRQFEALRRHRGGFLEGHRAKACWLYAIILRKNYQPEATVEKMVRELGRDCKPPLPLVDVANALKQQSGQQPGRGKNIKDDTIADLLDVTLEESLQVEMEGMPPAARFRKQLPAPAATREERRDRRRRAIADYVVKEGSNPPLRSMIDQLATLGITASIATIRTDYMALGIVSDSHAATIQDDKGQLTLF